MTPTGRPLPMRRSRSAHGKAVMPLHHYPAGIDEAEAYEDGVQGLREGGQPSGRVAADGIGLTGYRGGGLHLSV
jgi:hypothetical protein